MLKDILGASARATLKEFRSGCGDSVADERQICVLQLQTNE